MMRGARHPRQPMTEEAFLHQLRERPDDAVTMLVYADWLDDEGRADEAEFLRLQTAGAGARRRLTKLADLLPRPWLREVSRPRLEGTCWVGVSEGGFCIYRYLPG